MYRKDKIIIQSLHHKTHVAELWHGKASDWQQLELQELADILLQVKKQVAEQGLHKEEAALNIAMPAEDLVWPAAALMAWQQGLALHLAICVGKPADPCAQFIRTGRLAENQSQRVRQAAAVILQTIQAPEQAQAVLAGQAMELDEQTLRKLNNMVGVDVVSDSRAENYVTKLYPMTEYVLHPETGRTYTGLQDYRVMWAESTPSVMLALHSPMEAAEHVCQLLKLPDETALQQAMQEGRKRFEEY